MDQCNFNKSIDPDMLDGYVFKDSNIRRNWDEFLIKALHSKKSPDYLKIAKLILLSKLFSQK